MGKRWPLLLLLLAMATVLVPPAQVGADQPPHQVFFPFAARASQPLAQSKDCIPFPGAIFTSNSQGTPVNQNIYDSKHDVYLNGGPANKNGDTVPNGTYYYKVTDPSGAVNLFPDGYRTLVVASGVFPLTQLYPFDDTPNPGGEYKVWLSKTTGFESACVKTDNFKVRWPTPTPTRSTTPTASITPSGTPTATGTATPTMTPPPSATPTPSPNPSATATATDTATPTIPASPTPSATPPATPSGTPTATATGTVTPSPTASNTPTASSTPTASNTPTATLAPSITPTPGEIEIRIVRCPEEWDGLYGNNAIVASWYFWPMCYIKNNTGQTLTITQLRVDWTPAISVNSWSVSFGANPGVYNGASTVYWNNLVINPGEEVMREFRCNTPSWSAGGTITFTATVIPGGQASRTYNVIAAP